MNEIRVGCPGDVEARVCHGLQRAGRARSRLLSGDNSRRDRGARPSRSMDQDGALPGCYRLANALDVFLRHRVDRPGHGRIREIGAR